MLRSSQTVHESFAIALYSVRFIQVQQTTRIKNGLHIVIQFSCQRNKQQRYSRQDNIIQLLQTNYIQKQSGSDYKKMTTNNGKRIRKIAK